MSDLLSNEIYQAAEVAEESVIGSLVIDPEALVLVQPLLKPSDFYIVRYGWVYAAILALAERGDAIDALTIDGELQRQGKSNEVGGMSAIALFMQAVPTALNIESYAQRVREMSLRRGLLRAASEIAKIAYNLTYKADDLIGLAETALQAVSLDAITEIITPRQNASEYFEVLEARKNAGKKMLGHPTRFPDLDFLVNGLQSPDLIILAGRPAMGKTTLALDLASYAAQYQNLSVAVFSLEMDRLQINDKIMASESGIDYGRLQLGDLRDDEWMIAAKVAMKLADSKIYIDDAGDMSPIKIRNRCKRIKATDGLDLVVIDYLQLMNAEGFKSDDRVGAVGYISRQLKLMAKELGVPVIALSQLSRSCESRTDKRPMLSDLRDSGAVEQDADVVCFVYRDEVYNPDTESKNIAELIVAKNRKGRNGKAQVFFDGRISRFASLKRETIKLDLDAVWHDVD